MLRVFLPCLASRLRSITQTVNKTRAKISHAQLAAFAVAYGKLTEKGTVGKPALLYSAASGLSPQA